jgi:hypothetical protein
MEPTDEETGACSVYDLETESDSHHDGGVMAQRTDPFIITYVLCLFGLVVGFIIGVCMIQLPMFLD